MNRTTVLLALVLAAVPCVAQRIRVDYDHAWNFSHYRTYSWAQQPQDQDVNQLMQNRVTGFIEEALAARGLKPVKSGGDLLISYEAQVTRQDQYFTYTNALGPGWGWGWQSSTSVTTVQPSFVGTLVVNIADARSQRLIFQGVATDTLSSRPARNTKKYAASVRKIFEKYPPQ